MKYSSGIIRRLDDLNRIVIPEEIRSHFSLKADDPIEIAIDRENNAIVLTPYYPDFDLPNVHKWCNSKIELFQFFGYFLSFVPNATGKFRTNSDFEYGLYDRVDCEYKKSGKPYRYDKRASILPVVENDKTIMYIWSSASDYYMEKLSDDFKSEFCHRGTD